MRRKAEILKYSGVSTNSKTNNLSKAEKYAQKARFVKGRGSYNRISEIQKICPPDEIIKTPNYSCDVPGPYTLLYLNENIELYNYATGRPTVSIENPKSNTVTSPLQIIQDAVSPYNTEMDSISDVYNKSTPVAVLYTQKNKDYINQNYSFTIPVTFNYIRLNGTSDISGIVDKILVYVYYNKTLVITNDDKIPYTPSANFTIPNVVLLGNSNNIISQFTTGTDSSKTSKILGRLKIDNLQICNQPSAVYDIRIVIVYTTTPKGIIKYRTIFSSTSNDG